jgi:heme-degrading monooxygenase HmoA
MHITWSALELSEPSPTCTWWPTGSAFLQAGQAGAGRVELPSFDGRWWSVLALWDEDPSDQVRQWPVDGGPLTAAWHVVLAPASYRGDAVLSGGRRPFDGLPARGKVAGAAAVITLAGLGADPARGQEFFERFPVLGRQVTQAEGHRASLVQAPEDGAVLTFSAWRTLRDAVTWAYHRPEHAATVARQEEHALVAQSGFLRCAVVASRGTLHGTDPLAGLTGELVPREAA